MTIRQPLADQMRPHTLDQLVGQRHLLAPGKPLYQIITQHIPISLILWGPPGCGKSSLAFVMSKTLNVPFETFNASIENKATLMRLVSRHPDETFVLLLDEIHRLTKPIQDYLLPYLEDGHILLVGTTTENPIMAIVPAIRSRCQIFEFERISSEDIQPVLQRAARQFLGFDLPDDQAHAIANCGNGDVRVALNVLDTLHAMHPDDLDMNAIRAFALQQHFAMDKDATQHYDYLSAFQDSIEGSDTDAALYYLAVILRAGDLESVVRRLKDSAALDVGLASPSTVERVITLANTALEIGLPRASTHVAMATILLALAPKSDSVLQAYLRASKDAEHPAQHSMPDYLRDTHYKHAQELRGAGDMLNMYDQPHQVAQQAYMPADLIGHHYFVPRDNRLDSEYFERYQKLFEYIYQRPFVAGDQSTVFDHNFTKQGGKEEKKGNKEKKADR
jgi:putative ATPase